VIINVADYTPEINSAYSDIMSAGAGITIGRAAITGYDPVTEQSTFYEGRVSGSMSTTDTLLTLTDMTGEFSDVGIVQIGNEVMAFSGNSSGVLSITDRGYNSTTAGSHGSGDFVYFLWELDETYGLLKDVKQSDIDGTNIKTGDKIFLVPSKSLTFTPDTNCRIKQGNYGWGIVDVATIEPGGDIILYYLRSRRFHQNYPNIPISTGQDKQFVVFDGIQTLLDGITCVW